jgi:hypothetical protein
LLPLLTAAQIIFLTFIGVSSLILHTDTRWTKKGGATEVQLPTPEFGDEIMFLQPYRWQYTRTL